MASSDQTPDQIVPAGLCYGLGSFVLLAIPCQQAFVAKSRFPVAEEQIDELEEGSSE